MAVVLKDSLDRPLRNLRLSVTDRCNLRCSYCMPEPEYVWLPREDILHFEEIETLVDVFTSLGVDKVRLTGGEPLLRRDLPDLIQRLAARPAIRDLAMTTNGVLLAANAQAIRDAGLHRLTVSLDTLQPQRFRELTRYDELIASSQGIDAAAPLFPGLKIDTVVIRGVNDDELIELLEFGAPLWRRGPVHRIHGRRRRDALVDVARAAAARDADAARGALRGDHAGG